MYMVEDKKPDICEICGRPVDEYDPSWPCKKNHEWRRWIKDTKSEKFKQYKIKHDKAYSQAVRRRLDKLNKKPPIEYTSRIAYKNRKQKNIQKV